MSTVLVWILVTTGACGVDYSPPVSTLADCQRIQKVAPYSSTCVQVNSVVPTNLKGN